MLPRLEIDARRLKADFIALSEIGATGDGGVHRPALSETNLAARRWFRERIQEDGLEFHTDGAGNHSARLPAGDPHAATLLLGSHLDSVPYGGRYDGALGVLAAYEVLRTVAAARLSLPVHLEAIDFTDEEGTLVGLLGSRALAGSLRPSDLEHPRGGRAALLAGLERAELTERGLLSASRDPGSLVGFLELHIEQGPRLVEAAIQIGVVRALVGIRSLTVTYTGQADHAGTTPMPARRDAGLGAAALMLGLQELIRNRFPDCAANIGQLRLEPGGFNIVPGVAELALEFRAPSLTRLNELESSLDVLIASCGNHYGLDSGQQRIADSPPVDCHPQVQRAFESACEDLGVSSMRLVSGAGHDTQALASVCPAGMILIPSRGGSHSPRESARWEDCVNGANVLLGAVLRMAQGIH